MTGSSNFKVPFGKNALFTNLVRFWRCESGVSTPEFAVLAAFTAFMGIGLVTTMGTGARGTVSNTGFVVESGGPNYSSYGSGPLGTYAAYDGETGDDTGTAYGGYDTGTDTGTTGTGTGATYPDTDQTADTGGTGGGDTDTGGTETADNGETGDTDTGGTETADNGETGDTDTGGTETADNGETGDTDTGGTETADAGDTGDNDGGAAEEEEPQLDPSCYTASGNIKPKCL